MMGGDMDSELMDLARRAVACRGWRWMAGVRTMAPSGDYYRAVGSGETGCFVRESDAAILAYGGGCAAEQLYNSLPDLTDPATLGCLLALVREAHGTCSALHDADDGDWWLVRAASLLDDKKRALALTDPHDTEPAALVAALEAAP